MSHTATLERYIAHTRCWIDTVVIALNLCPFARQPQEKGLVRYTVCEATLESDLLECLRSELERLSETRPDDIETTILIHPFVLQDFYDYNRFLDEADRLLEQMDLEGEIQIASMHPDYQFAGSEPGDAENYTNRSPYPLLHLIREQSIDEALERYQQPERIPERNIRLMEKYGVEKMQQFLRDCMSEE